jgi:Phage integrase, N-terminal SAM-like domain
MGKRGNGEGSIGRRKDGLYMARYTVQTATGPKRKALSGKTRQEVAAKLSKALADRESGLTFDADNVTVAEYLARWLSDSARGTVRASTFERHEQIIRVHLAPAFGRMKLKTLTPAHVRSLHREKLEEGLAPATVRKIHSTLHKALSQAVADGLIPRNAADVKAPRPAPEEMRPLSEAEARTFLDAARERGTASRPSTYWRSPRASAVGSCWGFAGTMRTWTGASCEWGAVSCEKAAGTSWARPRPSGAADVSTSPPGQWRHSRHTARGNWSRG